MVFIGRGNWEEQNQFLKRPNPIYRILKILDTFAREGLFQKK